MPDNDRKNLTYKQGVTKQEYTRVLKAILFPIITFCLGMFVISNFANFGTLIISPFSAVMWVTGVIVAAIMPAQREEVLNQTMTVCCCYFLALFALKLAIGLVSGASSEMIAASFDQAIPTATGNAIPGYLQTALWFASVFTPIGFIAMQVKRLFQFKKQQSLHKTFGRTRSYRDSGRDNTTPY